MAGRPPLIRNVLSKSSCTESISIDENKSWNGSESTVFSIEPAQPDPAVLYSPTLKSFEFGQAHLPPATTEAGTAANVAETAPSKLLEGRATILTLHLTAINFSNSFITGIMTIAITTIARDLGLDASLVYWPVLAYTLTASPLMIPFGSAADILGQKSVNLAGTLCCGVSVLACAFARTGGQLIVFRGLQGIGAALALPTAMSIISSSFPNGRFRNISMSCLGCGQVFGYGFGLVLGGIFVQTLGWRFGFQLCGSMQMALFVIGFWVIPKFINRGNHIESVCKRLYGEIDWVGASILCGAIAMISYFLAMVSGNASAVKSPVNIVLLVFSLVLMSTFGIWMSRQQSKGQPALIPNSIWKAPFVSICVMIAFIYADMQCFELLTSLFFQHIQNLSPLASALRLLPGLLVGAVLHVVTGYLIHRVSIRYPAVILAVLASTAPLIMAFAKPALPYWYMAFPAQLLYPLCVNTVFVAGALMVAESFPERDQALAGAVFSTVANLGQALGLAIVAVVSNTVTDDQRMPKAVDALFAGYKAGFFTAFAWMILTAITALIGLRKIATIGEKAM